MAHRSRSFSSRKIAETFKRPTHSLWGAFIGAPPSCTATSPLCGYTSQGNIFFDDRKPKDTIMTNIDIAIDILRASNDGNRLEPCDLKLVELATNGYLNETGEAALMQLRAQVQDGSYFESHRWFHGIEHLTRDHQGYIYWKGVSVEHYSYTDREREMLAALELSARCRKLEAIGFPVNSRTVLSPACYEAAVGTPWKLALCTYYSFFGVGNDIVGIFFYLNRKDKSAAGVFAIEHLEGKVSIVKHEGAYEAFHFYQDQRALPSLAIADGYAELVSRFERLGVSAQRLEAEINGLALH
jgi:hypothetical protein